ncbi:uncharacterized protein [Hetaerina americana]|uniref:uncharacterized protein isoform X2 n=1 Tax=Hetaerina americana TaxID=62018 RepID=UPI003A7F2AD3
MTSHEIGSPMIAQTTKEVRNQKEKYGAMENSEGLSTFELEKPRWYRREKFRTECQQAATQGMTAFYALQHILSSSQLSGDTLDSDAANEGSMKSKWYKFILELSKDSWVSFGEGYNELLIAEKSMFEEALRFQEVFAKLKKGKECMTTSACNDTKMKLSMAQAGLDKMNFMRRLIILLVGVKDLDLNKHRDISDIVLHRCKQLNLLDDVLNC